MNKNETQLFMALVDISRTYVDMLKQLNQQSLNVFSSYGIASVIEAMRRNTALMMTGMRDVLPDTMQSVIKNLEQSYTNILSAPGMGHTLPDAMIQGITNRKGG